MRADNETANQKKRTFQRTCLTASVRVGQRSRSTRKGGSSQQPALTGEAASKVQVHAMLNSFYFEIM
jgi:hypothetical protein